MAIVKGPTGCNPVCDQALYLALTTLSTQDERVITASTDCSTRVTDKPLRILCSENELVVVSLTVYFTDNPYYGRISGEDKRNSRNAPTIYAGEQTDFMFKRQAIIECLIRG